MTQPTLRVLAIVPSLYDTSPGQRFRMEQWAPALRARGIDVTFEAFEDDALHAALYQSGQLAQKARLILRALWRRTALMFRLRRYDVVYVLREAALLGPAIFERWIRWAGRPLVFDFDDAVFERYVSPANGYLSYLKFPGKTRSVCRIATHVMAGNPYLETYARAVTDRITIVPTTIDLDAYRLPPSRPPRATLVIGWSGSYSTVQHLDTIRPVLQRLARTKSFRLLVIGTDRYAIDGVEVEARPWRAATEVEDLAEMDIGIMPLPDDRWSQGKCGLKALQYMALGIPTICSPVGANRIIIQPGENGLLADSAEEWIAGLTQLLEAGDLRSRLGGAGRRTVEEAYSKDAVAPVVADILTSAALRTHRRRAQPPGRRERE
jgi:glycosyltransferase involved in cell wall biosynthesis